jgi:hypothetical protein
MIPELCSKAGSKTTTVSFALHIMVDIKDNVMVETASATGGSSARDVSRSEPTYWILSNFVGGTGPSTAPVEIKIMLLGLTPLTGRLRKSAVNNVMLIVVFSWLTDENVRYRLCSLAFHDALSIFIGSATRFCVERDTRPKNSVSRIEIVSLTSNRIRGFSIRVIFTPCAA